MLGGGLQTDVQLHPVLFGQPGDRADPRMDRQAVVLVLELQAGDVRIGMGHVMDGIGGLD